MERRVERPGEKLKRARERLKLTYRDVEKASQLLVRRRGSVEFAIALSRLADLPREGEHVRVQPIGQQRRLLDFVFGAVRGPDVVVKAVLAHARDVFGKIPGVTVHDAPANRFPLNVADLDENHKSGLGFPQLWAFSQPAVQGTSLYGPETGTGSETESEAGSSGEWPVGGSEWVAHVCSPYVFGVAHRMGASEYHDISEPIVMQRCIPAEIGETASERA